MKVSNMEVVFFAQNCKIKQKSATPKGVKIVEIALRFQDTDNNREITQVR